MTRSKTWSTETTKEQKISLSKTVQIDDIEFIPFKGTMVDIEVEDNHTFFACQPQGGNFVLTHNTGWPDVDSDAADRDIFIDVAKKLFGDEAVIPVSNFNTLQLKSLIKDISKFYGVPFEEVNAMTGPLLDEVMHQAKDENTEKGLFMLKHEDCMQYSPGYRAFMEKYPDVCAHVSTLFKQNKSIGRHAGGVLIAPPELLEKTMPLISVRGEFQTPWPEGVNFRHLEDNGFLKFDFLGLTLLRDVANCIKRILKKQNGVEPSFLDIKAFFDKHLNCRYNKPDDPKVWKYVYHQRRKTGIFQFTEQGARKFCEDAKPMNITELAAITSIFRPGPLKAGVHKQWVEVVTGKTEVKFDHPIIEDVLKETKSFIVFQEDFMLLAQKVAGFTPGESDKMRKTLVKKSHDAEAGKVSERDELRKKFMKGALANGFEEKMASDLFDKIEYFAGYGFNKSCHFSEKVNTYDMAGKLTSIKQFHEVAAGDYLKSRDEKSGQEIFVPVVAKHDHGVLELVEVELTTGEKVKCTWDHKFRTVETGEMLPLWMIQKKGLSIVVDSVENNTNS